MPQLVRVAVLWHPRVYGDRTMAGMLTEIERAAQELGMKLQLVPAAGPEDIAGAFSAMIRGRAAALSVFQPDVVCRYGGIASLAADNRLPAIYAAREGDGGLMSYGANLPIVSRQTALYVDKNPTKEQNRRSCPCSNRPNSSWSLIARPQRRSASLFPRASSPLLMR